MHISRQSIRQSIMRDLGAEAFAELWTNEVCAVLSCLHAPSVHPVNRTVLAGNAV